MNFFPLAAEDETICQASHKCILFNLSHLNCLSYPIVQGFFQNLCPCLRPQLPQQLLKRRNQATILTFALLTFSFSFFFSSQFGNTSHAFPWVGFGWFYTLRFRCLKKTFFFQHLKLGNRYFPNHSCAHSDLPVLVPEAEPLSFPFLNVCFLPR